LETWGLPSKTGLEDLKAKKKKNTRAIDRNTVSLRRHLKLGKTKNNKRKRIRRRGRYYGRRGRGARNKPSSRRNDLEQGTQQKKRKQST